MRELISNLVRCGLVVFFCFPSAWAASFTRGVREPAQQIATYSGEIRRFRETGDSFYFSIGIEAAFLRFRKEPQTETMVRRFILEHQRDHRPIEAQFDAMTAEVLVLRDPIK